MNKSSLKVLKFKILYRNVSNSVVSSGVKDISLTPELKSELENGLKELKEISKLQKLDSFSKNEWNQDGWVNLKNDKLLEKWELLRKLQKSECSQSSIILDNNSHTILSKILNLKSPSEIILQDKEMSSLVENLNPIFAKYKKSLGKSESSNIFVNNDIFQIKDGKLIIDINQTNEIVNKSIELLNNLNNFPLIGGLSIGIGGGLLYRAVVNSYSNSLDSIIKNAEFESMSEQNKLDLLNSIKSNKSIFNKSGGVLITIALYTIIQAFSNKHPINIEFGDKKSSSNLDIQSINSFFFLIFKNKIPKWLQYIVVIIFFIISGYIFIKYINPYIIIYINFNMVRKFTIFVIFTIILFYLYSVYILIDVSKKGEYLTFIKILPKKLKNHINWLMEIKNSSAVKFYIQLYLTNAIYMFILLLLFTFITSLLDFI